MRLVCLAVTLRLLAIVVLPDSLGADPDGYLAFARNWSNAATYGFVPTVPSAHRPPGYPVFLLALDWVLPGPTGIAVGHITAATLAVCLTGGLASRLGAGRFAWLAMLVVAVDPLLIRGATLIMTETLFTALFAVLLRCSLCLFDDSTVRGRRWWRWVIVTGLTIAAAALVRPIAWAVWCVLGIALCVTPRQPRNATDKCESAAGDGFACENAVATNTWSKWRALIAWCGALAIALAATLPWIVRNYLVFGVPILTSTHGGYTLWLGQNPVYYAEVVAGPHAVWPEASFQRWTQSNLDRTVGLNELERDRFYRDQALAWMRDHPGAAAQSIGYHVWSLWSPAPRKESLAVRWYCGVFYTALYVLAAFGLCQSLAWRPQSLLLPTSLVSFTIVHAIYWSDVRMRTPLVVVLAVLAGLALSAIRPQVASQPSAREG